MRQPAEGAQTADIEELARGAVGLRRIEGQATSEAGDLCDQRCEIGDTDVFATAEVDETGARVAQKLAPEHGVVEVHHMQTAGGHVVDIEKFAPGGAGTPDGNFRQTGGGGFDEFAQQGRQYVRGLQIEVIAGAVEIRRHDGDELRAILAVVGFAHFQTGDLGNRVGLVRRFERAAQQVFLAHRLRAFARINA